MRKRKRFNAALDLFGEVPVTESDIVAWVAAIAPRWLTPERSFNNYVKNWDVAAKIRAAKLDGTFDAITDNPGPAYHARLALIAIC